MLLRVRMTEELVDMAQKNNLKKDVEMAK